MVKILEGDCLETLATLATRSVHCCVTSPPYYRLRDYGNDRQIGLEETPEEYVEKMVSVFRLVRDALRVDGTVWLNLGDSYGAGKQLLGIPWQVAFALQADGWCLRQDIIWHKPNPMPESVRDRCTKAHEYLFLLSKSDRYYFDPLAIAEESIRAGDYPGNKLTYDANRPDGMTLRPHREAVAETRNKRSVWTVYPKPYKGAHFAVMPPELVLPCIRAGTSEKGCCPTCGTPHVRKVERQRVATRPGADTKIAEKDWLEVGCRDPQRHCTTTATVGWEQGCECGPLEPIPCTVLDPFFGSGTTGAVAVGLGRRAIGCELNPDYIALARERIAAVQGPLFS